MAAARKLARKAKPRVSAAEILRLARFPAIRGAISKGLKREVPKEVTIPRGGRYVRFTIRPAKDRAGRALWVKELFSTIPIGTRGTRAVIGTMRADVKKPKELRRFLSKLRGASDSQRRSYIYQMRRAGIIGGSKTQAVLVPKQRVIAAVAKYTGRRVAANPILATLGIRPNPASHSKKRRRAGRRLINRSLDNRGRRARRNADWPTKMLGKISMFLAQHRTGEEVDQWVEELYQWIKRGGDEPDWSKYPLGTSYYEARVAGARRRGIADNRARRNPSAEIPTINIPFRDGQKVTPSAVRNWLKSLPASRVKTMLVRRFEQNMKQYRRFHLGAEPKTFTYKAIPMGASKDVTDVDFVTSEGKEWSASYQVPSHSGKYDPTVDGRYIHSHGESGIDVDIKRPAKRTRLPERFHTADGKFVGVIPSRNVKITDWYRG